MATNTLPSPDTRPDPEKEYAITISPPLLNTACPWATTYDDLLALYNSPHTGAVTIRTSLWSGFPHNPAIHQYTFFSSSLSHSSSPPNPSSPPRQDENSSLNTLGYSPIPFPSYTKILINMSQALLLPLRPAKPFILSVTGTPFQVAAAFTHLSYLQSSPSTHRWKPDEDYGDLRLWMEINLSCPNIPGVEPPAYDAGALGEYVDEIADARGSLTVGEGDGERVHVGIKVPPYTHAGQFRMLISCLENSSIKREGWGGCPISFITSTNTLGSCLVLDETGKMPAVNSETGDGIGGMAGAALHPLALGNVRILRRLLDASEREDVRRIAIIGVGGVGDREGWERMRGVGAQAVGVATALGREGVGVFEKIMGGGDEAFEEFVHLE